MAVTVLLAIGASIGACGDHGASPPSGATLNIYSWAAFIGPHTIANFERETGIKVRYDTFESDEMLEAKLLAGHTNYDVVVPSDLFFERDVRVGILRPLDRAALPNVAGLDPDLMRALATHDPGNRYGIPYLWSTTGIAYNVPEVRKRLGSGEFDSWSLLLDPRNAAKLKDCGISVIDSPTDVIASVLMYLGKDPNSRDLDEITAAADVLMKLRPYVRSIVSVGNIVALANGNVCAVLGWSGDMAQARYRALEAGNGVEIRYFIPREGGVVSMNTMAIPADAPHPQNAQKWLNYLMRPDVIAEVTNEVKFPNAVPAALEHVDEQLRTDPAVYPDGETRKRMHALSLMPPDFARRVTRLWVRFRTGR